MSVSSQPLPSSPASPPPLGANGQGGENRKALWLLGAGTLLLLLLCGWLAVTVIPLGVGSRIFTMPNKGMQPTIEPGDYVYVNLRAYRNGVLPARGELVVFWTGDVPAIETGNSKDAFFLKRAVGLPGDTISIVHGKLTVNGLVPEELDGLKYVTFPLPKGNLTVEGETFTVPPGEVYVLGDNSPNSYDSRFWGTVPLKALRGRVESCVWPVERMRKF